jgi:hypothetical protein
VLIVGRRAIVPPVGSATNGILPFQYIMNFNKLIYWRA